MSPLIVPAARLVAGTATSLCVGKVVSEVIKNNVNVLSTPARVQVAVGSAALSMVIAGAATARVESFVGDVAQRFGRAPEVEIVQH
jgi:hypothetical protein